MTETAAGTGVPVSIQLIGGPAALLEIGPTDAVLLSHDQPGDNLDRSRRALFAHADVVLTAPEGADRLGRGVADNDRLRVIAAGERITL
jgi:hypothetical protein